MYDDPVPYYVSITDIKLRVLDSNNNNNNRYLYTPAAFLATWEPRGFSITWGIVLARGMVQEAAVLIAVFEHTSSLEVHFDHENTFWATLQRRSSSLRLFLRPVQNPLQIRGNHSILITQGS